MSPYYYSEMYLQHHGILGQKWGVRRFQNYDGSLTAKGKQRELKSARQYKRALNRVDQGLAEESRSLRIAEMNSAKHDITRESLLDKRKKAVESGNSKKVASLDKKITKVEGKLQSSRDEEIQHKRNIGSGLELTDKLISDAERKGYTVSSKTTKRNVTRGREYVLNALSIAGSMAIGSPIAITMHYKMPGKAYKVSKPKD